MMLISLRKNFVFIANSKTASSSIEAALRPYEDDPFGLGAGYKHLTVEQVRSRLPDDFWQSAFKFAFVRNPYDWFTSQWFYIFGLRGRQRPGDPVRRISKLWRHRKWLSVTTARPSPGNLANRTLFSVDDVRFLHGVLGRASLPARGLMQSDFVSDGNGNKVDFVGRYEQLGDDFNHVTKHLGLSACLPEVNSSQREREWRGYFDDRSGSALYDLWRTDFAALEYRRFPCEARDA